MVAQLLRMGLSSGGLCACLRRRQMSCIQAVTANDAGPLTAGFSCQPGCSMGQGRGQGLSRCGPRGVSLAKVMSSGKSALGVPVPHAANNAERAIMTSVPQA